MAALVSVGALMDATWLRATHDADPWLVVIAITATLLIASGGFIAGCWLESRNRARA
jgi:hypothetical protein